MRARLRSHSLTHPLPHGLGGHVRRFGSPRKPACSQHLARPSLAMKASGGLVTFSQA